VFWRHRNFIVDLRGGGDEQAFRTVARNNHFAILAAFENGVFAIQTQIGSRSLLPMTTRARRLQHGFNVFIISDALVSGRRGKVGNINLADVPFVDLLLRQ
jgi:hypothetical protein